MIQSRLPLIAAMLNIALISNFATVAHAAEAGESIWIEGEQTSDCNVPKAINLSHYAGHPYLSDGKWLRVQIPPGEGIKSLPPEGLVLSYDFTAPAQGSYAVWNRIGYEFIRSPFSWRVDNGAWTEKKPNDLTIDLMLMEVWNEVAWLDCGRAELSKGKHRLDIQLKGWSKEEGGKPVEQQILYCSDAICLSTGTFRPNGKHAPGTAFQDEADQAAAKQVFALPSPAAGERAEVALKGAWQIARFDEQDVSRAERAHPILFAPPVDDLFWYAIQVPGDRNEMRKDFNYAHRYFYRTRVSVPAGLDGRGFYIHFPETSLIASVFVNGQLCGTNNTPLAGWDCDISKAVKPGQANEVWVGIKDCFYALADDILPPPTPNLSSAAFSRRCFNAPISFIYQFQGYSMPLDFPVWGRMWTGLIDTPTLVVCGGVYVSDAFVQTSVAKQRIGLELTLTNTSSAEATVTIANACVPVGGKAPGKQFASREVKIAAGKEAIIPFDEAWTDAKLWWPDDAQLYTLVTTISRDGKPIDTRKTTFGFREWTWNSPDFRLNGIVFHGRADLTAHGPGMAPEAAVKTWHQTGQNMVRLWADSWQNLQQEAALDFFDRNGVVCRRTGLFDGEMVSYMLGEVVKIDGKDVNIARRSLFGNWERQLKQQVKTERNHPSVMIWSIENEIVFINSRMTGQAPHVEPAIRDVAKAVMALDPTRPVMVDGGHALLDKSLPVNGVHYGECEQRDLPDGAYTMTHLYDEPQFWTYDKSKPGFLGETYFADGATPAYFSGVQGEAAFLGHSESCKGASIQGRMYTEGFRWSGVSAFHFWWTDTVGGIYNAFQPVVVLCRQWNWTFASGSQVARTLKIINDTHSADPIEVTWELMIGSKSVQRERKTFAVPAGSGQEFTIAFKLPRVAKGRTAGELLLIASRGGKEIWRDHKPLVVINPNEAAKPRVAKADLLVLDPQGAVQARLKTRGIEFTPIANFEALPAKAKIILIGADAITSRQATSPKLLELAADGTRVVVLDQDHPLKFQALPADLDPTAFAGSIAFSENLEHPVFAGLRQEDFFTWSKDHRVYRNVYKKSSHGARSLVQCDYELGCSAMAECPVNDGLMLVSQLAIGAKLDSDPVAQRLFDNLLNYVASYQVVRKVTAVVAEAGSPWAETLGKAGLKFDLSGDVMASITDGKHDIVIVQASRIVDEKAGKSEAVNLRTLAAHLDQVKAFTARGGYLMICGLTPEGLADYNQIVGFNHVIRPFEMERTTLATPNDMTMAGLTSRDVVMESGQTIAYWAADKFMANDVFTCVVDLNDIAPFCTIPGPDYFKNPGAQPGGDKWPRNLVNGFTTEDSWRYAFTICYANNEPTKWTMTLPKEEELTELSLIPTKIFSKINAVKLYFNDEPEALILKLKNAPGRQDLVIPPRKASKLTMELDYQPDGKTGCIGIDNLWLKVTRAPDFADRVKPMLNIGAMIRYPMGKGGIILNNLRVNANESVPVNAQKKQAILSTILRNLGATFAGGKMQTLTTMTCTPIPFNEQANAYFIKGHGTFSDADLSSLPVGDQKFAGVAYSLRDFKTSPAPACAMIRALGMDKLPAEVSVKVGRKADALFFLQTLIETQKWQPNGDQQPPVVAKYVVTYADGKDPQEIPLQLLSDIASYVNPEPLDMKRAVVAWVGKAATPQAEDLVAYQMQWTNPRPDAEIQSVTLKRDASIPENWGAPVWLALTVGSANP